MWSLRFCARALSNCGEQGPLFIAVRGLSCCRAQAPDAQAQQLQLTGPAAPRHVGSSQTRAQTRVPCIGRQTLNHFATREAPIKLFLILVFSFFICLGLAALTRILSSVLNSKPSLLYPYVKCDSSNIL